MLVTRMLNQTIPEVRHHIEAYIWRPTSLLVVTLLKLKLKPAAFSGACESYSFLCNTSRHLEESHLVDKLQTLHCQSEHSGRSGLGPITFLQTKHAHEYFELIIHIDL